MNRLPPKPEPPKPEPPDDRAATRCDCLTQRRGLIRTGGREMAKKKVPISIRDVIQLINRKLAAKGQILMTTRHMKMKVHCGDYYILDLSGNVMDMDIDPEELARQLGVLKEGKEVERTSGKSWADNAS